MNLVTRPCVQLTLTQNQFCTATIVSSFFQCHTSYRLLRSSVATLILIKIYCVNPMSVVKWSDAYDIYRWRILLVAVNVSLSGVWTREHWIRVRRSNQSTLYSYYNITFCLESVFIWFIFCLFQSLFVEVIPWV